MPVPTIADTEHSQAKSTEDAVHAAVLFRFRNKFTDTFGSKDVICKAFIVN